MKMYVVDAKNNNAFEHVKRIFSPSKENLSLLNRLNSFLKVNEYPIEEAVFYEIEYDQNRYVLSSKKIDDEKQLTEKDLE